MGDKLKEKMGPFPVWVWGVVLGVIIVAAYWWSRRGTSSAPAASSTVVAEQPVDLNNYAPTSGIPTSSGTATNVTPNENTNQTWLAQASAWVQQRGFSPLSVQTALMKYLSGVSLSASDTSIVNEALSKFGTPPDGVMAIPAQDAPAATTPAASSRSVAKYIQAAGRGVIYAYYTDGSRQGLTAAQWAALGGGAKNNVQVLPAGSAEFQGPEIPAGK